jgi:L,D-transpeptidase catalytic domain
VSPPGVAFCGIGAWRPTRHSATRRARRSRSAHDTLISRAATDTPTHVGDGTPRGGTDHESFHDDGSVTILRALVLAITLAGALLGTATAATAAPVLASTAAAAPAAKVPCSKTVRACVRLSTNQAWLLDDGKVVSGPVPISHGRKGFATPAGSFRVSFKNEDHVSSIYDQEMPYSVFFNGGIAFHQGSVRQKSHGCIHLTAPAARKFFAELEPGDRVQVVA